MTYRYALASVLLLVVSFTSLAQKSKRGQISCDTDDFYIQGSNIRINDRKAGNGLGYKILRVESSAKKQLSEENTVFEIRYDFDLKGNTLQLPENTILKFVGGKLFNGHIIGNKTSIEAPVYCILDNITISGDFVVDGFYPEWFGISATDFEHNAKIFNRLSGYKIKLLPKQYVLNNITLGANTSIVGCGLGLSVLKQADFQNGDFITFENWSNGLLRDFSIKGGKGIKVVNNQQALIKIRTTESVSSSYHSSICNLLVSDSPGNGISFMGKDDVDNGVICNYNWILHIDNVWVYNCAYYGIYDAATDNLFSNLRIGTCGKANIFEKGGSNMWQNLKLDGESGYFCKNVSSLEALKNEDEGALLIINGSTRVSFNNLDCQSSGLTGIKLINCTNINIQGDVNNCGVFFSPGDNNLLNCPGLYLKDVRGSKISLFFGYYDRQFRDIFDGGNNNHNLIEHFRTTSRGTSSLWHNYDIFSLNKTNTIISPSYNFQDRFLKVTLIDILKRDLKDKTWYVSSFSNENSVLFKKGENCSYEIWPKAKCPTIHRGHYYLALASCKMIHKPSSTVASSLFFPYFNVIGEQSTINSYRREYRDLDKLNMSDGDRFLVSCVFNIDENAPQEEDIAKIRMYSSSLNDGDFSVINIRLFDLTEDIGITHLEHSITDDTIGYLLDIISHSLKDDICSFRNIDIEYPLIN